MQPIHILHKYHCLDKKENTMQEHINVYWQKGSVWWGIIGKGMSIARTQDIVDQLNNNIQTKVLLTSIDNLGNRIFHEGTLIDIITDLNNCSPDEDDPDEFELIPEYYEGEKHVTWLQLSEINEIDKTVINKYSLQSNPSGNLESAMRSQTSIMYIIEN